MGETAVVRADMVGHLRIGLHTLITDAAQELSRIGEIPDREQHPEHYGEPLAHLDWTRALLDRIGWGDVDPAAAVELDLREHFWALSRALEVALQIAVQDLEEAHLVDDERARRGEPPGRNATTRRVLALRKLASAVAAKVDGQT